MYKVVENLSDLDHKFVEKALKSCFERNFDPTFSIDKLIARIDADLIIMFNGNCSVVVAEMMVDDFGCLYFFIWGAYSESPVDIDELCDSVYNCATDFNCVYIEFGAQRTGWGRKLESRGLVAQPATIYRKFIDAERD